MEHWFDALSQPWSRRTVLKGAALAGAALLVPAVRVPRAAATEPEPCFVPCQQAAAARWDKADDQCHHSAGSLYGLTSGSFFYGQIILAGAFAFIGAAHEASCTASAELRYHRDSLACRGSGCGGSKYPGESASKPLPPKCDPMREKVCGDICCNVITDCCLSAKTGRYLCYAAGHHCEGA